MRITKRVVDQKRHTVAFVLDGRKTVTRDQAVALVDNEKLTGYYVGYNYGTDTTYIASKPNHRYNTLLNLPVVVKA